MAKQDYYEILGVPKTAEEREIKRRISAAMKFHPDRNQGDKEAEAKFKEIKEAYEVLTDAQNVRPMISTDTRPLNRAAWAAVDLAAAASAAALISAISLVMYLAISSVAGVAVSARRARRPALQHGPDAGRSGSRRHQRDPYSDAGRV